MSKAPTAEEVRAREAAGLPLAGWRLANGKVSIARFRASDTEVEWDWSTERGEDWYALEWRFTPQAFGEWLGWCPTPDEIAAIRKEERERAAMRFAMRYHGMTEAEATQYIAAVAEAPMPGSIVAAILKGDQ